MADEQSQMPVYYRVDIGQEFPERQGTLICPIGKFSSKSQIMCGGTVKGSLQLHAMEIVKTAIGKLRSVNDPLFQPHAHQAERVDFDAICEAYPERDFTFPDFIPTTKCRAWFLKKSHSELP